MTTKNHETFPRNFKFGPYGDTPGNRLDIRGAQQDKNVYSVQDRYSIVKRQLQFTAHESRLILKIMGKYRKNCHQPSFAQNL